MNQYYYLGYVTKIDKYCGSIFPFCKGMKSDLIFYVNAIHNITAQQKLYTSQQKSSMDWLYRQLVVFKYEQNIVSQVITFKYLHYYSFIETYNKIYRTVLTTFYNSESQQNWTISNANWEPYLISVGININSQIDSVIRSSDSEKQKEIMNNYSDWCNILSVLKIATLYRDYATHFTTQLKAENFDGPVFYTMQRQYIKKWIDEDDWFNSLCQYSSLAHYNDHIGIGFAEYEFNNIELFEQLKSIGEGEITKQTLSRLTSISEARRRVIVNTQGTIWGHALNQIQENNSAHKLPSLLDLLSDYFNDCEKEQNVKTCEDYVMWRLKRLDKIIKQARDIIVKLCCSIYIPSKKTIAELASRDRGYTSDRHGGF